MSDELRSVEGNVEEVRPQFSFEAGERWSGP